MSWFWAWNFANTLSVNDVIFAKRLTDITPYTDYIEKLTAIFAPDELDDIDTLPEINYPAYSSTNFLSDVYMTRHDYDTLVDVLKMKKILFYKVHLELVKHLQPNDLLIPLLAQKILNVYK